MAEGVGAVEQEAAAAAAAQRQAGVAAVPLGVLFSMVAKEPLREVLRT